MGPQALGHDAQGEMQQPQLLEPTQRPMLAIDETSTLGHRYLDLSLVSLRESLHLHEQQIEAVETRKALEQEGQQPRKITHLDARQDDPALDSLAGPPASEEVVEAGAGIGEAAGRA